MNKYILFSLIVLSGCAYQKVDVDYKQVGTTCEYTETYGVVEVGADRVGRIQTIKYPNTQCSKVIESDLKNAVNKNLLK